MRHSLFLLAAAQLIAFVTPAQTIPVRPFHRVIISPYIQATFVEGDQESVTINNSIVDSAKLHVEVRGGTLRIYLEGAKDFPRNRQGYDDYGRKHSYNLYPNHAVVATITYRDLDALSLRGEETFLCQSPLSARDFTLRVYGDGKVIFTETHFSEMHATLYGDASVDIRSGDVNQQYYTSYGDGHINATAIAGQTAKLTAFGEAEFRINVSDWIRITSFGEAKLRYMGNPEILKGLHFGGVDVQRLD